MSSPLKAMQAKNLEITSARRGFQPRPLNSYTQPLVLSNQTLHPWKKINKKIPSGCRSKFLESVAGRCFPHFFKPKGLILRFPIKPRKWIPLQGYETIAILPLLCYRPPKEVNP